MIMTCAVDRIEGSYAVVVADSGTVYQVPIRLLGQRVGEGAVLRVPVVDDTPHWERAERDRVEEARRRAEAKARLETLRRTDDGGDVVL